MTTTTTVTDYNSAQIAEQIAAAVDAGKSIKVNGYEPIRHYTSSAATSYQNGTVGINVKGKRPGSINQKYIKVGAAVTIILAD